MKEIKSEIINARVGIEYIVKDRRGKAAYKKNKISCTYWYPVQLSSAVLSIHCNQSIPEALITYCVIFFS